MKDRYPCMQAGDTERTASVSCKDCLQNLVLPASPWQGSNCYACTCKWGSIGHREALAGLRDVNWHPGSSHSQWRMELARGAVQVHCTLCPREVASQNEPQQVATCSTQRLHWLASNLNPSSSFSVHLPAFLGSLLKWNTCIHIFRSETVLRGARPELRNSRQKKAPPPKKRKKKKMQFHVWVYLLTYFFKIQ